MCATLPCSGPVRKCLPPFRGFFAGPLSPSTFFPSRVPQVIGFWDWNDTAGLGDYRIYPIGMDCPFVLTSFANRKNQTDDEDAALGLLANIPGNPT